MKQKLPVPAPRPSREESEEVTGELLLRVWSGMEPSYLEPPKNAQEIFSVYSQTMGYTFEETMMLAAKALLANLRVENQ